MYARPLGEFRHPRVGRQERFGEAPVACVQLTDPLDHQAQAAPWIRIGAPLVDDGTASVQLVREGLGDQCPLGREVPVQGGGAHPRRAVRPPRIGTSRPSAENSARAAPRTRSRLSRASERGFRGKGPVTALTLAKRTGASVTFRDAEALALGRAGNVETTVKAISIRTFGSPDGLAVVDLPVPVPPPGRY